MRRDEKIWMPLWGLIGEWFALWLWTLQFLTSEIYNIPLLTFRTEFLRSSQQNLFLVQKISIKLPTVWYFLHCCRFNGCKEVLRNPLPRGEGSMWDMSLRETSATPSLIRFWVKERSFFKTT